MGNSQSENLCFFSDEETKTLASVYNESGFEAVIPLFKEKFDNLGTEPLNIAVTGESGTGKSAFINAMRGLRPGEPGAAKEGLTEQTKNPTPYQHPDLPSVYLWDLPGMGTGNFPCHKYLEKVNFKKYDFFILITGNRFKENDARLAREIKKMGKEFYFVRSRIDIEEYSLRMSGRLCHIKDELDKIRRYCIESLVENQVDSPRVFLVSSKYLHGYDFLEFCEVLESELPEKKKHVFVLSLPNLTQSVVKKKKKILSAKIILAATVAAGAGAIPIPGLSFACDVSIIVSALLYIRRSFGLTEESLERLACKVNIPVEELKAVVVSPLVFDVTPVSVTKYLSKSVAGVAMLSDELLHLIPIIGSVLGASVSFTASYWMLSKALDEFAESAEKVVMKVFECNKELP
ncbi:interferon-inducible GTPase 5-like [Polypterus senegalus]